MRISDWSSDVCSSDLLDVHVAERLGAQHRHALALGAELLVRRRARRHGDLGTAGADRRHLDTAAERRRDHRQRDAAVDVGAVALEQAMRRHREKDVEIACGRAAQPSLALAGQPDAGAVLDALRDVHLQRLFTMHPPGALAGAAGLVDHLAAAVTGGTGAIDGEEALLGAHAAAPVAGLAADRLGPPPPPPPPRAAT